MPKQTLLNFLIYTHDMAFKCDEKDVCEPHKAPSRIKTYTRTLTLPCQYYPVDVDVCDKTNKLQYC